RWLRDAGHESHIFCLQADPGVAHTVKSWKEFPAHDRPDSLTILHYALPSPLNGLLRGARGRKAIIYHNITPPEFLVGYGEELAHIAREGRRQLRELAGDVDLAMADSEYNRRELVDLGFPRSAVLPICYDFPRLDVPPRPVLMKMFEDDFTNFLFVGRVAPNKRFEDLIRVYACYKRFVRERSRLFLVGSFRGFMKYYHQLQGMLEALKLGDVYFTGHVELDEMATYYRLAHVFLCMSEHEGFCVPLLESMHLEVPVVAYDAGAVAGTLRGAGVLVRRKDPEVVAELCHMVYADAHLRRRLVAGQTHAVGAYGEAEVRSLFFRLLEEPR
ncbi:glycosyltransferase family 4 protein, partial [bacterium]|nr:glycosyltransferase family 4 protein [candidate division CSSED10-310 bacterium]